MATLDIKRVFVSHGMDPYATVIWEKRTAELTNDKGETIFRKEGIEVPSTWSQLATNIVASKYFHGNEASVKELVDRVVDTIARWGMESGLFSQESHDVFRDEMKYMLIHQLGAFNSPVWFNVGLAEAHGAKGDGSNCFRVDPATGKAAPVANAYANPQGSACFILSVEDNMKSIMDLAHTEAMLFKYGSGCGTNLSPLRSSYEKLSSGGTPSGPLSFMRVFDQVAGVVKSGGRVRRAAKMQILDVTHPNVMEFITCKTEEEKKAWALIEQGYSGSFGGEAYSSVMFQNANLSVRLSDKFMEELKKGGSIGLKEVRTGAVQRWVTAKSVMRAIAEGTHLCGDPGVQFDDTVNNWNTCAADGRINASNPCQPGYATLLTPDGIRTMDAISVGDVIWSGSRWTTVTRKIATGVKPVYNYITSAGMFSGTEQHRVVENGIKVEVESAQSIDVSKGGLQPPGSVITSKATATDILAGLLLGDGTYKVSNKGQSTYCLLYVGEKDESYFADPVVGPLINEIPFDGTAHRVLAIPPLDKEELPHTYARVIPERYLHGDVSVICAFLRGLYSANGSICGGRVTLKATSFAVIQGVQQMLSAAGIKSYYTTNKSKAVEFSNGNYECKQSYDLNITSDKDLFARYIGFIQPYKTAKLDTLLRDGKPGTHAKVSYDIHTRKYVGDLPVYDITVDAEEHTYWTGGLLVSNCSEYMGMDNTACNLASLNLMKFMYNDRIDRQAFRHAVELFIIAQDILVGACSYPTAAVAENSIKYRPLGLGYANLGAVLMSRGLAYDSDKGRTLAARITALMTGYAYQASAALAQVAGVFPAFSANETAMRTVMRAHATNAMTLGDSEIAKLWATAQRVPGFRNSQVTVLAPTGTIGFMMDCDTTGVEPELGLVKYKQLVGGGSLKLVNGTVEASLRCMGYSQHDIAAILQHIADNDTIEGAPGLRDLDLPVFDCAFTPAKGVRAIPYMGHLRMMASVQPFLSGAISKTVNMPNNCTIEEIEDVYVKAWEMGLKAVAIYRDGSKRTQPLNTSRVVEAVTPAVVTVPVCGRKRLPMTRTAVNHKFVVGGHEGYLTVGMYDDGTPGEMFITMAKEGSTIGGLMGAFSTAISIGLQYGVPLRTFIGKFRNSQFEPSGFTENQDVPIAKSLVDYIFTWMEQRYIEEEPRTPGSAADLIQAPVMKLTAAISRQSDAPPCSNCGHITVPNGKCHRCEHCGTSMGCS